jgi:hypothetical protein
MTPYIAVADAEEYFDTRLDNEPWLLATENQKLAALVTATRIIDRLKFKGVANQDTAAFPRTIDGVEIPVNTSVEAATCEIALSLLDGVDPEAEYESLTMTSQAFDKVRSSYNRDNPPHHILAGVPSITAWRYLSPYLVNFSEVELVRIS